ncbi:MAG TPA: DUF6600 domain-containing protein [Candidatus Saccharimonadales bacterium]|nr:DUF6600 domain-containing protein [Candidatus Saccharimonadales bacterium]
MRHNPFKLLWVLAAALAMVLLLPHCAAAQDEGDDNDDPPSRVARLAYTSGEVSFEPAGTDDWVAAVLNRPITTGDKLWSDNNSRAELNIGSASIRLSSTTGFSFLNLTDSITQIRLTEGTLRVRVKDLDENETFEIDTPNLAFSVLRTGTYRVTVNEGGDTTIVKVLSGQGEANGGGQAYTVHANEVGTFNGTDDINGDVQGYGNDEDDFDNWCADRDRREDRSVSAKYVSTDVIGYQDLDDNGGWRDTPEYGTIWFPHTTIVGWAPYHYGHWAYIAPWGYTWVDDAPWGFAPFHYGRWVTVRGVWGWVPVAPRPRVVTVAYVRPVYAPALVAWVGGPHFGIGVAVGGGGGNVGWFPLGPREVYVPSYHVSRRYVNRVNVSNTTVNTTVVNNYYNTTVINKNVTNVTYVNQRVPGAVAATNRQTFVSAQSVSRNVVKVDAREAASAPVAYNAPAVAPSRQAVLGGGAAARVRPPAALQARAVVAKTAPPPAPATFAKQQQAIEANGGRPLAPSQTRQIEQQNGQAPRSNIRIAPPAKQVTPQNGQVSRPGQPGQPNRPVQPNAAVQPNAPGQPNNAAQPGNAAQQNKAAQPNTAGQPNNAGQNNNANRPGNPQGNAPANAPANAPVNAPGNPGNRRTLNDRPNAARPAAPATSPQLEQKQQQQQEQLRQKQDQERQRVEQQQVQQQQKLQQQNDLRRQQQTQQKQQQQLEQLEHKHDTQQQKLEKKQTQEQQKVQKAPRQSQEKDAKPPKKDKPHSN